jgi:hypothetical protein
LEGRGRGQESREGDVGAGGQVCEPEGVEKDAWELGDLVNVLLNTIQIYFSVPAFVQRNLLLKVSS